MVCSDGVIRFGCPVTGWCRDAGQKSVRDVSSPLSSHHDRACELFYQLKGGVVDYGEKHSKKNGHARFGRKYRAKYPEWSSRKPLHFTFIGHSMGGGNTVRTHICDQHLLDRKFFPGYPDTSANWICSLSCVSSHTMVHCSVIFWDLPMIIAR